MNNKILITYASQGGSTAGIAEAIGKTFAANGIEADVLPLKNVAKALGGFPRESPVLTTSHPRPVTARY